MPPPATFWEAMLLPVPGGEGPLGMVMLVLGGRVGTLGGWLMTVGTGTNTGTAAMANVVLLNFCAPDFCNV